MHCLLAACGLTGYGNELKIKVSRSILEISLFELMKAGALHRFLHGLLPKRLFQAPKENLANERGDSSGLAERYYSNAL